MKKLLTIFLILCLTTSVFSQWSGVNPMLGEQVNKAHQLGDPVALWLLNEGSGNKVFDLSGNGNTGTFSTGGAQPSWIVGNQGPAINFVNDSIAINNNVGLDSGIFTIVVGVRFNATSGDETMVGGGATPGGSDYPQFRMQGTGLLSLQDSQEGKIGEASTAIAAGGWHQCATSYDGTNWAIFIDGRLDNSGVNARVFTTPQITIIGATQLVNEPLIGDISYVYIYNRVLSASEIALLYREPFCMFEEDLPVAQMYSYAAPPAGGGQVIFIQMSAIPLILIITLASVLSIKWKK